MRRLVIFALVAVQFAVGSMAFGATAPLDRILRRIGIGWSPGYHAPDPDCVYRNSLPWYARGVPGCARCGPNYHVPSPGPFMGPISYPDAPWEILDEPQDDEAYEIGTDAKRPIRRTGTR